MRGVGKEIALLFFMVTSCVAAKEDIFIPSASASEQDRRETKFYQEPQLRTCVSDTLPWPQCWH